MAQGDLFLLRQSNGDNYFQTFDKHGKALWVSSGERAAHYCDRDSAGDAADAMFESGNPVTIVISQRSWTDE